MKKVTRQEEGDRPGRVVNNMFEGPAVSQKRTKYPDITRGCHGRNGDRWEF